MKEKKEGNKIKQWFNRIDEKLKPLKETHIKMNIIKEEIIDNQRLLDEYKMDQQNIEKKMISNRNTQFNYELENKLLRKVNLNNFNELDHDNIFLKNVLRKIKERKENIKKGKQLPFKRYKTDNNYININKLLQNNDVINKVTPKMSYNLNNLKFHFLKLFSNNQDLNTGIKSYMVKKEKPLMIKQKTNLILNLHSEQINNDKNEKEYSINDVINLNNNRNMTENNVNFFETLSQEDKYGMKKSNSKNDKKIKIKNMIKMIKLVKKGLQNCELSGNILNKNIEQTRNFLKLNNSKPKILKQRKLIMKINYSKIKDLRDVEKQIFNGPKENMKTNKSAAKAKSKRKKNEKNDKDKNQLNKKFLILPKMTTNNRSYLKKNDKFVI
jgi:hypothetical protein